MTFQASKILVFGATGAIGRFITEALLRVKPKLDVSIFTSPVTVLEKSELLDEWKGLGLRVITGNASNEKDVKAAYDGINTVVSCLGRGALLRQTDLLKWAEESSSVQWFFPSEYGTDIEYSPKSVTEKPHQNKLKIRRYIRENIKHVKVTYLVTGPFIDMYLTPHEGAGGYDVRKRVAAIVGDGEGRIGFVTMADVGKFLVAALQHPEASFNRALKVQSFVVTPNEILAEFEKQAGAKWDVKYHPLDQLRQLEEKLWNENSPVAALYTLRRIWAEGSTLYERTDNEAIGLRQSDLDTLEEAVKQFIAEQTR